MLLITMPIPASSESLELIAVNQILSSIGQAPVTDLNQTNPDVAIAYNTLLEVSRDVQTEGWTFNKDFGVKVYPQADKTIPWAEDVIEMNISQDPRYSKNHNIKQLKEKVRYGTDKIKRLNSLRVITILILFGFITGKISLCLSVIL